MLDWSLLFLGGLLGSTHCAGMCGGMAVTLGLGSPAWLRNLARQLVYSGGRVFTYSIAGAAAALGGARLSNALTGWGNPSAWLALVAGGALVAQGLFTVGAWSRRKVVGTPCLAAGIFRGFLRGPGLGNAFAAGMLTGFLPCGLLYAFLALAASSQRPLIGALMMAIFATGTIPLMLLVGLGASSVRPALRRSLMIGAAACVAVTGGLSVVRGVQALAASRPAACPYCSR